MIIRFCMANAFLGFLWIDIGYLTIIPKLLHVGYSMIQSPMCCLYAIPLWCFTMSASCVSSYCISGSLGEVNFNSSLQPVEYIHFGDLLLYRFSNRSSERSLKLLLAFEKLMHVFFSDIVFVFTNIGRWSLEKYLFGRAFQCLLDASWPTWCLRSLSSHWCFWYGLLVLLLRSVRQRMIVRSQLQVVYHEYKNLIVSSMV